MSEIDLDTLLTSLPTQLSYSFVSNLKLARRDLFDARFQLISEGTNPDLASALEFIDHPSDLVPRVYEGGLKTWECSLDLARCLARDGYTTYARGKRVLELGCGTAIPTLCILNALFSSPSSAEHTHVHLQDYNPSVLHLVTMPNILLAWYTASNPTPDSDSDSDNVLHITPHLVHAFKSALDAHHLHLRFFSGSWTALDDVVRTGTGPYHLVLTSETIYQPDALPSLVRVLQGACLDRDEHVCLVAGKTVYFGVGGGAVEFAQCVEAMQGRVERVWETSMGVSRRVMRVRWT